ncbi:aminotransferase class V-fold PLP-dependent enzyme [Micromonospora sp. WMMA1923]|uniref:aminotransferase class V-fold PLP-dependent enzyme n=1 Tax=Micromonospora sp. WMMA1923 TaxID=3404125 RepID=UPI003B92E732
MTTPTSTPVTAIRARFPSLAHTVHLATCSITARSTDLDHALTAMADDLAGCGFWAACEEQLRHARQRFAHLIDAHTDQVMIVPNARIAALQAVAGRRWRSRPDLLGSYAEFPGIAHAWLAQQSGGAQVRWCDTTEDAYLSAITTRTALVSVPAVTYRDAIGLDVARIANAAHAAGAAVFVDAYQAAGVMPLSVDTLRCDYLVAGTGKYLLGLPGLAFLYARDPHRIGFEPATDHDRHAAFDTDVPTPAFRFTAGTPSAAAAYTAAAGLTLIETLDLTQVRRHTQQLITDAAHRLTAQGETVRLHHDPDRQGAHLALVVPNAEATATHLARQHITVAPRGGVVRVAVHAYTTHDDITALCDALATSRTGTNSRQPTGAHR